MSETNQMTLEAVCSECGTPLEIGIEVSDDPAPEVRSKLKPTGKILPYSITSEDMKVFIQEKAKMYIPGVKVELAPRYCEKKTDKKNNYEPHRSYASLRIAFSQEVIEKNDTNGWYGSIGIDNSSVTVTKSILTNLVNKYSYNIKTINQWLSSYKILEELEESLGITESYLNDLKEYAIPRRVKTTTGETWVIFSAAAENIIADMLTEVSTDKVPGRIKIVDVAPISKDIIEFTVHLYPEKTVYKENPAVRKILTGSDKKK